VVVDWDFDPMAALRRWPADRPVALLHSGRLDRRWARYSMLAEPTGAYRFELTGARSGRSVWLGERPAAGLPAWRDRPTADLRRVASQEPEALWVGYMGYDVARVLERLPVRAAADRDWPAVQMQRCPGWLVYDGVTGQWTAHGAWAHGGYPALGRAKETAGTFTAGEPVSPDGAAPHAERVQRVKDYIAAGDVFQVNLAQRFSADITGDPRGLFTALAGGSPAWYGAHVELLRSGDEPQRAICSTSPELFLEVNDRRQVMTRPIKGTRPAEAEPAELAASEKDAAELHMIVDLLRNDLGRVCDYGSVQVTQPRTIESHPTVHHGVASVTGRLHQSKDVFDLLKASLPGGSVTGAPKVRAMEIIEELEPVRRGPYCGAIGWLQAGRGQLNIAIRTMLVEQNADGRGRVDYSVGGGIVADSDPAAEHQETLDKAQAMERALKGAAPRFGGLAAW